MLRTFAISVQVPEHAFPASLPLDDYKNNGKELGKTMKKDAASEASEIYLD